MVAINFAMWARQDPRHNQRLPSSCGRGKSENLEPYQPASPTDRKGNAVTLRPSGASSYGAYLDAEGVRDCMGT
jgi:hypothetical protein